MRSILHTSLFLFAATALAQTTTNNLLDQFVSVLTSGDQNRASELLDVLQSCSSTGGSDFFNDVVSSSLNASRTCATLEITRESARRCVERASHAFTVATSPYTAFSTQKLSTEDIDALKTCADGLDTKSSVYPAFEVLAKRFFHCGLTLTPDQKTQLDDVFWGTDGTDQMREASRTVLSTTCASLRFTGELHADFVNFFTETAKAWLNLVPASRLRVDDPSACADVMMRITASVTERCGEYVQEALTLLSSLPSVCQGENEEAFASLDAAFERGGSMHTLATCALRRDTSLVGYASALSAATFRQMTCLDDPSSSFAASEGTRPTGEEAGTGRAAVFATTVCWTLLGLGAVYALVRHGLSRVRRRRGLVIAWWLALCATGGPAASTLDRGVDPDGFVVRDEATRCAFDTSRLLPASVAKDHAFTVLVPRARAVATYRALMRTPVEGRLRGGDDVTTNATAATSLHYECGHCALLAWNTTHIPDVDLIVALVLDDEGEEGEEEEEEEDVAFAIRFPMTMDAEARLSFVRALALPKEATFACLASSVLDSQRSATPEWSVVLASVLLLTVLVRGAVGTYVARGAWTATLATILALSTSVGCADAASRLLDLPFSPFSVLAMPLVVGTGVDALLLLLHQRATGSRKWVERALPSVVASQLSTSLSFALGSLLNVPHVRHFFLYMVLCNTFSLGVQTLVLPALVVLATRTTAPDKERGRTRTCGPQWTTRIKVALPLLTVAVLWGVILQYRRPLNTTFDMRKQLRRDTRTHHFMHRLDAFAKSPVSLVYALTQGGLDRDWTRLDAEALSTGCLAHAHLMTWHSQVPPNTSVRDWRRADSMWRTMTDPFVSEGTGASVSLVVADFDMGLDAQRSHDELSCLARKKKEEDPTCYASFERLGGYTVVSLLEQLRWLAATSCVLATAFGVSIARGRGVLTLVSLALSYGGAIGLISVTGMSVDMLLVAVMLVAPGLIVDYTLHLLFHPDAAFAVFMSGVSSVASVLPYLLMPVDGVRDFALVYCLFIALGLVHAFALVATTELVRYHGLPTVDVGETTTGLDKA